MRAELKYELGEYLASKDIVFKEVLDVDIDGLSASLDISYRTEANGWDVHEIHADEVTGFLEFLLRPNG